MGLYDVLIVDERVRCVYCGHPIVSLQTKDLGCLMNTFVPGNSVRQQLYDAVEYGLYREEREAIEAVLEKPFFVVEAHTFCDRCFTWHDFEVYFEQMVYTGDLRLVRSVYSVYNDPAYARRPNESESERKKRVQPLIESSGLVVLFTDRPLSKRSRRRSVYLDWLSRVSGASDWRVIREVYAPTIHDSEESRFVWLQRDGMPSWMLDDLLGFTGGSLDQLPPIRFQVVRKRNVWLYEPLFRIRATTRLGQIYELTETRLLQEGAL